MFTSVLISFLSYVTPELIFRGECKILTTDDKPNTVAAISIQRFFTHFAPVIFSIFVFWHSRGDKRDLSVRVI